MTNIDSYDPNNIAGRSVDDSWFEAINMVIPTFIDPDVADIYRMCLNWDSYNGPFVDSVLEINRENQIQKAVQALITKYNPERDDNE